VKYLYVYYDARCGICCRAKDWLTRQPAYVPLRLVPAEVGAEELTVVSDAGEVYRGDKAWLMVLWALCEYRSVARRLASPTLRPFAREAFRLVSASRQKLSGWLGLVSEAKLKETLAPPSVGEGWTPCRLRE
jgi:predicted DCC family thiol-disulfide oxidoreductase YuxK